MLPEFGFRLAILGFAAVMLLFARGQRHAPTRGWNRVFAIALGALLLGLGLTFDAVVPATALVIIALPTSLGVAADVRRFRFPATLPRAPLVERFALATPIAVDEATRLLAARGFVLVGDTERSLPRVADGTRFRFMRFLVSPSRTSWVEIQESDGPKGICCVVKSILDESETYRAGHAPTLVSTSDGPQDAELLSDRSWFAEHVREGTAIDALIALHDARCATVPGSARPIDDVVSATEAAYETWAAGLVRTGMARVEGQQIVLQASRIPIVTMRIMRGWLV